ncbi:MAG: acetyl-CoA acetyltransferase [Proteobacteria bacterium]|nr:acetyl-CoA acetyltransferase [Pseudomonadota bacterium]
MHGKAVVVGVGESEYYERGRSPHSEFQLACIAIRNAVEDAGLKLSEIDGFVSYMDQRNPPLRLAQALGVDELRFAAEPFSGGGNNVGAAVQMADAAVSAGYARHVVVFRAIAQGQFGRFGAGRAGAAGRIPAPMAWTAAHGLLNAAAECAMHTRRFMHDHDISQEALCDISLACYANAQRNPRAIRYGRPLTREAYHESRWIVEPFHLFDCCPENDGAAAVVVSTPERARDLARPPVSIVAAAQGIGPWFGIRMFQPKPLGGAFYGDVGRRLWSNAGLGPEDIDVAQFYENFTGPVLMAISEMGFCEPGEVEDFVADGALVGPDARFPFNTSGGNIGECYVHGFGLVNEAVRQVRGESTCQVKDVEHSLMVAGPGYSPGSAVLFGRA